MYQITIQYVDKKSHSPTSWRIKRWVKKVLKQHLKSAELTIRITDVEEMTSLNSIYRNKQGPTNVLSFPLDLPKDIELPIPLLGDIILCAEVVNREALEQQKPKDAHWAHMIVHGCLHLLGYDHEKDDEAEKMESLEISILHDLGFDNPYVEKE